MFPFFFSSRRPHTISVSAFLLNRSTDLTASRRNPTYQAGLRRDAVQPDIEAERKKRDEIEARSEERRVGKEWRYGWWWDASEKRSIAGLEWRQTGPSWCGRTCVAAG